MAMTRCQVFPEIELSRRTESTRQTATLQ